MFRIQYASNLFVHQNYTWKQGMKWLTPGKVENLALLGNIGNPASQKTKDFIRWCSENWKQVYCVPGPLELQNRDSLNGLFNYIPKNVHILDTAEYQNGDFVLMGCPVWSKYGERLGALSSLSDNDKYFMANKTPKQIQYYHDEDLEWIHERFKYHQIFHTYNDKCIILLTHWLPSKVLLGHKRNTERDILLHVGGLEKHFNANTLACLSGAGGNSVVEYLGNTINPKVFCGVNAAFLGPHMVPNSRYNPLKYAEFPMKKTPVVPQPQNFNQTEKFLENFTKYLPKPLVVNAYPNLQ